MTAEFKIVMTESEIISKRIVKAGIEIASGVLIPGIPIEKLIQHLKQGNAKIEAVKNK